MAFFGKFCKLLALLVSREILIHIINPFEFDNLTNLNRYFHRLLDLILNLFSNEDFNIFFLD